MHLIKQAVKIKGDMQIGESEEKFTKLITIQSKCLKTNTVD